MWRIRHIAVPFVLLCLILLSPSCGIFKKKQDSANLHNLSGFDNYYIDACTYYNNGSYSAAIKLFNRCLNIKPAEASVYYQLSKCYQETKDQSKCFQNAMKAYELAPENVYYALWYASKLRETGQIEKAYTVLEQSVDRHPKDIELVKALDQAYSRDPSLLGKRIALWLKYKQAAGYKLNTALKLIELYKLKKDYAAAHAMYDEIKKASPLKYKYFVDDGNLYLEQNDVNNAILNFEKAIAINPNNFLLNISLYRLRKGKGEPELAEKFLRLAISDKLSELDQKLKTCTEISKSAEADSSNMRYVSVMASELAAQYPENEKAQYAAAGFYEMSSQFQLALIAYQKTCTINPNVFDAWFSSLRMANKTGDQKQRAAIAESALEYFPGIASLYLDAGKSYYLLGMYERSLEHSINGLSFATDNTMRADLMLEQGKALIKTQKYADAINVMEKALAINPNKAELYEYMGDAEFKSGHASKAVDFWKKAKEMGLRSEILNRKITEGKYVE